MAITLEWSFGGVDATEVDTFALQNHLNLPEDYKRFLSELNGGRPVMPGCFINELNKQVIVDVLCGLTGKRGLDLNRWLNEYRSDMPPGFLIIGKDPGGNFFILGTDPSDIGVYYWDHTHAFDESSEEGGNTYRVASNFTEFFDSLMPIDD